MRRENPFFSSPYPTNPAFAGIADGLSRAIFGDPVARAEQEEQQLQLEAQRARIAQAQASADYDIARTRGVDIKNSATQGLGGVIGGLFTGSQPEAPRMGPDGLLMPQDPVPVTPEQRFNGNLPAAIAALVQSGADPREAIAVASAFAGGDELARRGMVAQGRTPGENFAITPERADDIRAQDASSALARALGVAEINNASDIPVAEIRAGAAVDSARIRADGSTRNTIIKEQGAPVSDGRSAAMSVYPGLRVTSNRRGKNDPLTKANPGSYHASSNAAVDAAPIPGMTFERYVQGYRDAGYTILEARDEVNNPSAHSTGPHWHVVLGQKSVGARPKAKVDAASKPLPANVQTAIGKGIDTYADESGMPLSETAKAKLIDAAMTRYRRNGNLRMSVAETTAQFEKDVKRIEARKSKPAKRTASKPTVSNW